MEEIEALIGPVERAASVESHPAAPGQLRHHYAPRKLLKVLAEDGLSPSRETEGWLIFGEQAQAPASAVVHNLSPAGDMLEAAANFFRFLRALDDDPRVTNLVARRVPEIGLGRAINERLERASAPR